MMKKLVCLLISSVLALTPAGAAAGKIDAARLKIKDYISDVFGGAFNGKITEIVDEYLGSDDMGADAGKEETESDKNNESQKDNGNTNTDESVKDEDKNDEKPADAEDKKDAGNATEADSSVSEFEMKVIELVNAERAKIGLGALQYDKKLSDGARAKSRDLRDGGYFAHESPTYGSPFDMMKSFGITYRSAGENIAKGYATPEDVVLAWMNSEGHRKNILNASYNKIGVGYVAGGNYWTQWFTN